MTMENFLKKSCTALFLTASILTVSADDSVNLIKNPYFEATDGKITGWGSQEKETIESFINPADSEKCGKIKFTYFTADKKMSKSNIYQLVADLDPGDYILGFSLSGENLKGVFAVVRFQKEPGIMNTGILGKFEKYIAEREMPEKGKWKKFVFNLKVTEGSENGVVIIETFGDPDKTGYALINNVRLAKQEE